MHAHLFSARPPCPWALLAPLQVLVHIIPAYAVFSQPFFAFVERSVRHAQLRCLPKGATTLGFRIVWRSFYVGVVLLLSIAMPFFTDVVGLIGAIGG